MSEKSTSIFDPLADAEEKKKRGPIIYLAVGIGVILAVLIYFKCNEIMYNIKYVKEDVPLDSMLGSEWKEITVYNTDDTTMQLNEEYIEIIHNMLKDITITYKTSQFRQYDLKYIKMTINGHWVYIFDTNYITIDKKARYKMHNYDGRFYDDLMEIINSAEDEAGGSV